MKTVSRKKVVFKCRKCGAEYSVYVTKGGMANTMPCIYSSCSNPGISTLIPLIIRGEMTYGVMEVVDTFVETTHYERPRHYDVGANNL